MRTERDFALSGTENTRDLGGIALPGGQATAFGRFLRSDVPTRLTEAEKQRLLDAGFDRVLDLRSRAVVERVPGGLASDARFVRLCAPLAGGGRVPSATEEVAQSYMEICAGTEVMRRALAFLADAPRGVLFHCTAGKDRTGVLAALLLMLAGAQDEAIAEDYARSQYNLDATLRRICREHPDRDYEVLCARPERLLDFLRLFRRTYADAQRYGQTIGLEQARLDALRTKLRASG